jgi:hypothetical protein
MCTTNVTILTASSGPGQERRFKIHVFALISCHANRMLGMRLQVQRSKH